jgi:hypothetical protein
LESKRRAGNIGQDYICSTKGDGNRRDLEKMAHNYSLPAYKILGNFALMLVSELESKRPDNEIIDRCKSVIRTVVGFEPGTMISTEQLNDGVTRGRGRPEKAS